jgi:ectonucleotide pyrophosphatase/phosphodiesterase family protein 5
MLLIIYFQLFSYLFVLTQQDQQQQQPQNTNKLLLISIDGFRNDYIQKYKMENLLKISKDGVSASYLKPQFITQTLPTHWSIVTGLYQETHGIISQNFHDPDYNENFKYNHHHHGKHDVKWFNLSEPIWYTGVKEGLKCASLYWPGGNVKYMKTNLYKSFDHNDTVSLESKIEQTVKWFVKDNYNFVALYHDQLDSISHRYGISSLEFNGTLKDIDDRIGYLIDQLVEHKLYDSEKFHLIIVSGHGMADVKKNVFLDDYLSFSDVKLFGLTSTSAQLKVSNENNNKSDDIMRILNDVPFISAFRKESIPEKWHYRNSNRVGDIFILANEGINLYLRSDVPKHILDLNEKFENFFKFLKNKADHGFDNGLESMKTIFIAKSFLLKKNFMSKHYLEQVDVYPLMCRLLDIECRPNNGSLNRIRHYLHSIESSKFEASSTSRVCKIVSNYFYFLFIYFFLFKICVKNI